jgi:thiamine-phosphate pyrophosphorylase
VGGRLRTAWRILDANLNRAREAARVAEEHARFVLDSAADAERLKALRHELRSLAETLGPDRLLGARDTPGDVGTGVRAPTEAERSCPADVLTAAFKRLEEALRVLEEYAKPERHEAAAVAEALRYRVYEIESCLLAPRARVRAAALYVIVTGELCGGRDPAEVARAAARGGAGMLQLREKSLEAAALLDRAKRLRAVASELGTLFVVNDRADLAAAAEADGVHVGQEDLPCAAARRLLGAGAVVGVSARSVEEARRAQGDGADYVGVGTMFATATKAGARVGGPDLLREVSAAVSIPVYPIGGITAENVSELVAVGAERAAVCRAVISADDPEAAARALRAQLPAADNE